MRFVLCPSDNWWGTHRTHTLQNHNFSFTIWEIDICESGSPKSPFIIISSSRNVQRQSSLNSVQIVLTDSSVTTFEKSVHNSLCTSHRPSRKSQHYLLTICMLMKSLPYTSVNCLWISAALVFFVFKNCITARGTHARTHTRARAIGSSMFVVLLSSFLRAERQPKIQCCHNPKQNISPIFITFEQLNGERKNGKLTFGKTDV